MIFLCGLRDNIGVKTFLESSIISDKYHWLLIVGDNELVWQRQDCNHRLQDTEHMYRQWHFRRKNT